MSYPGGGAAKLLGSLAERAMSELFAAQFTAVRPPTAGDAPASTDDLAMEEVTDDRILRAVDSVRQF